MIIIVIALCLLILYNITLSVYCYGRKRKSSIQNSPDSFSDLTVSDRVASLDKPNRSLKMLVISLFDSLVFLSFKIVGYIPSHLIRILFYKLVFHMSIGKSVVIYYGLEARCPWNIIIGNGCIIGDHTILDARYGIVFGSNVNLSTGVWIWTLQHDYNAHDFNTTGQGKRVIIEDRAWISCRVIVLPGVYISEGCVVAAGAVVTKDCDIPFCLYGGVPAKSISKRNEQLDYEFDGSHRLFI